MAKQLSLKRYGVVPLDDGQREIAPGSQPQKSSTTATNGDSDLSGLTMDGQSRMNDQHILKIAKWNAVL